MITHRQRTPGSGGVNKIRNRDFINALKTKIAKDPTTSIRKIAAELKVDPKTVRTVVHDAIGLTSYVRIPRWKVARKYSKTKNHGSTMKIFSDEKIFTVDAVLNHQNDWYLAESIADVKGTFRTKHPAKVMVLSVMDS